jgi:hypothetical protein
MAAGVARGEHDWQQPESKKRISEHMKDLAAKNPGQKQLDKIYRESKSTCWINLWNKDGHFHTQHPDVAWEERTRTLTIDDSSCTFFKREDLKDGVKPCEITNDGNKPPI